MFVAKNLKAERRGECEAGRADDGPNKIQASSGWLAMNSQGEGFGFFFC